MNYIGSKTKLLPFLQACVQEHVGSLEQKVMCDLFAGSGAVGRAFKPLVKTLISNDIEYYSFVLNQRSLQKEASQRCKGLINVLQHLSPIKGFIYEEYSVDGRSSRAYFSAENAQKIDAIRLQIEAWKGRLLEEEYFCLLASLLEAADKVANTTSIYTSFLKSMKKTAQKPLHLELPLYEEPCRTKHLVFQQDANQLIETIQGDILYLDPPYNIRQYGATYHLLNTIALYDRFEPQGKTGLRAYYKSRYCGRKKALHALHELIAKARFETIFLSYNDEGLLQEDEIGELMRRYGNYTCRKIHHPRLKTHNLNKTATKTTTEHLHILQK